MKLKVNLRQRVTLVIPPTRLLDLRGFFSDYNTSYSTEKQGFCAITQSRFKESRMNRQEESSRSVSLTNGSLKLSAA